MSFIRNLDLMLCSLVDHYKCFKGKSIHLQDVLLEHSPHVGLQCNIGILAVLEIKDFRLQGNDEALRS
jgi:hypothetical protein